MSAIRRRQGGAVSIFVVIFTALLISVITVSFVRIMMRDQRQATEIDLSQSAYDTALSGVEDAKRALSRYYDTPTAALTNILNSNRCSTTAEVLSTGVMVQGTPETFIQSSQSSEDDARLDQAYTCVTIALRTDDYVGSVGVDKVSLVPLSVIPGQSFDTVQIDWFSREDMSDDATAYTVPGVAEASNMQLPLQQSEIDTIPTWASTRPPLLEAQLIQAGPDFRLSQFDQSSDSPSNTNTLSLYPMDLSTAPAHRFEDDVRQSRSQTNLQSTKCQRTISSEYSCSARITLPEPVDASHAERGIAYLRLTPRYNDMHFKVSLYSGSVLRQFDGVQPQIDSTGRANNLFRRVIARVEPGGNVILPNGAVDISGNFCKTFRVTDEVSDYDAGECTP